MADCLLCGNPLAGGASALHYECRDRYTTRIASGLCVKCGGPNDYVIMCNRCRSLGSGAPYVGYPPKSV